MPRLVSALVVLLFLSGLTACGGDDDGGTDEGRTGGEPAMGGMTIEIDPDSGPPGSTVRWSVSGCEPSDDKSASLYGLPLDEYREGTQAKSIADSPEGKSASGTITVPPNSQPGDYTLAASCGSTTPEGGGQFTIGVSSTETAFTVTE